jgi:hypothetical protein
VYIVSKKVIHKNGCRMKFVVDCDEKMRNMTWRVNTSYTPCISEPGAFLGASIHRLFQGRQESIGWFASYTTVECHSRVALTGGALVPMVTICDWLVRRMNLRSNSQN